MQQAGAFTSRCTKQVHLLTQFCDTAVMKTVSILNIHWAFPVENDCK